MTTRVRDPYPQYLNPWRGDRRYQRIPTNARVINWSDRSGTPAQKFQRALNSANLVASEYEPVILTCDPGVYTIDTQIDLVSDVVIIADGAKFVADTGLGNMFDSATADDRVTWYGGHFDGNGESVTFMDFQSPERFHIENVVMNDMDSGVVFRNDAVDCRLTRARFTNHRTRAVYVVGSATLSATNIELDHLVMREADSTGSVRRYLHVVGDPAMPHQGVNLHDIYAVGLDTSYNNATTPGTADQVVVYECDDVTMNNIRSFDGGDVAIVATDSRLVKIVNCHAENTDSLGLSINGTSQVQIHNFTAKNVGQSREGDRPTWARNGIGLVNAADYTIIGSAQMLDDQGTPTMQYGLGVRTGVTNAQYDANEIQSVGHAVAAIGTGL